MVASLNGSAPGKTSGVKSLRGIYTTSSAANGDKASGNQTVSSGTPTKFGYQRIKDEADEYYRINPFAVENNYAPDPTNTAYGGITTGTQFYSLAEWDGYQFPSNYPMQYTVFNCTTINDTSVVLNWTRRAGYNRDAASLDLIVVWDQASTGPFSPYDDQQIVSATATSVTITGLTAGTEYSFAMFTRWKRQGSSTNVLDSDFADVKDPPDQGTINADGGIYITTTGGGGGGDPPPI